MVTPTTPVSASRIYRDAYGPGFATGLREQAVAAVAKATARKRQSR